MTPRRTNSASPRPRRRRWAVLLAAAAVSVAIAGCGEEEEPQQPAQQPPAEEQQAEKPSGGGAAALALKADEGGALSFDKKELTAKAGEVTIDLDNPAQVPHNVALEKDGQDVAESETVTGAKTKLTETLEAGEYTYYCAVGNHRQAGMEGKLTVE